MYKLIENQWDHIQIEFITFQYTGYWSLDMNLFINSRSQEQVQLFNDMKGY